MKKRTCDGSGVINDRACEGCWKCRRLERSQKRRQALFDLGLCILGPLPSPPPANARPYVDRDGNPVVHGKPVRAGKCQRCLDVHAAGDTSEKRAARYREDRHGRASKLVREMTGRCATPQRPGTPDDDPRSSEHG